MYSSSSSSSATTKFDVFLSFCSRDPANTFVSDLNRSLERKQVTTNFKDDSSLAEDSKLAVVVVSESYPISVLCLNQLETIVNCHDQGRLSVLPIFYGVNPSNVKKQTGDLAEPFSKLGKEYPDEKIEAWRISLAKLTNIPNLHSKYWGKDANMIDLITNEILSIVSVKVSLATKAIGLVGLDRQMQTLYEMLDLKATEEVRLIGIWGPGGIGKTTLARHAYEEISSNFNVHLFVDKAEKIHHQDSVTSKLLSKEAQKEIQTTVRGSGVGMDKIKLKFGHRKGLVVIDCVDTIKQLKDIADIAGWCIPGSRVIFVTQDMSLLLESGVEHAYEVQSLRYDEALQLFSHSAFDRLHPPTSFESLSLRAVQIAGFLPLTLRVLGSSLRGKDAVSWERELQKLEGDQEEAIMEVMEKSYSTRVEVEEEEQIPSFILSVE